MNLLARLLGEPVPAHSALKLQEKPRYGKQPFLLDVRQSEEFGLGISLAQK
jgi:hypothetical protein